MVRPVAFLALVLLTGGFVVSAFRQSQPGLESVKARAAAIAAKASRASDATERVRLDYLQHHDRGRFYREMAAVEKPTYAELSELAELRQEIGRHATALPESHSTPQP